jgi:hypothetical protein
MPGLRVTDLQSRPREFLDVTSLPLDEFSQPFYLHMGVVEAPMYNMSIAFNVRAVSRHRLP